MAGFLDPFFTLPTMQHFAVDIAGRGLCNPDYQSVGLLREMSKKPSAVDYSRVSVCSAGWRPLQKAVRGGVKRDETLLRVLLLRPFHRMLHSIFAALHES